jgi:hypothetical protein
VPRLCEYCLGIYQQLRKKARNNLSQDKKNSVRLRKISVTVQYTYYQKHPHKHTLIIAVFFSDPRKTYKYTVLAERRISER